MLGERGWQRIEVMFCNLISVLITLVVLGFLNQNAIKIQEGRTGLTLEQNFLVIGWAFATAGLYYFIFERLKPQNGTRSWLGHCYLLGQGILVVSYHVRAVMMEWARGDWRTAVATSVILAAGLFCLLQAPKVPKH